MVTRLSLRRLRNIVEANRLLYLCDLPSAGDTSYAGVVIRGDELLASYYTSPPEKDYTSSMVLFRRTDIRMARIDLPSLKALAVRMAAK